MGQVIQLPPSRTPSPDTTAALDSAEATLLLALRWWVADRRQGVDPLPRLCQAMTAAGATDAAFSVDQLMGVVARTARRQVELRCPRCPRLAEDERTLLYAAGAAQGGESALAERVLRTTLLSAAGAEFALGPLVGLGELFAQVRLFFTRRASAPPAPEAWSPDAALGTVH